MKILQRAGMWKLANHVRDIAEDLTHVVDHNGEHPWAGNDQRDNNTEQFRDKRLCLFIDLGCCLKDADDQANSQSDQ